MYEHTSLYRNLKTGFLKYGRHYEAEDNSTFLYRAKVLVGLF